MKHISYVDEHCVLFSQDKTILEHCPLDFEGPYVIPNSVTTIGYEAFWCCKGLTNVEIPNSVTLIEDEAFSGCDGLKKIIIPNSVTEIGAGAFRFCFFLKIIEIPDSVTKIWDCAFDDCMVTTIRMHHKDPNQIQVDESAFWDCDEHSKLCVPEGTKSLYSQHPVFGQFKLILEITDEDWDAFVKAQELKWLEEADRQ